MSFLFGGTPPTVNELTRKFKFDIQRNMRGIQREKNKLSVNEKQLFAEIKRNVSTNPKITLQKAREVVRIRQIAQRMSTMESHLQGILSKVDNMKSVEALSTLMTKTSTLVQRLNKTTSVANMTRTIATFSRENNQMMTLNDLIDDQLEGTFDDLNDDEEQCDDLVSVVLSEAGIDHLPSVRQSHTSIAHNETIEQKFERLKARA